MSGHFDNDDHAVLAGLLLGHLLERGIEAEAELDDGDYTPVIRITLPTTITQSPFGAKQVVVVVRAPRKS